ncbi:hypothetical protein HHI36_004427, partial [Cryptolaemus montrouzieri]
SRALSTIECGICKQKKPVFSCEGCKGKFCKNRGQLTASEIKVLELASRIIASKEEIVNSKNEIISSKDEVINMLKNENLALKNEKLTLNKSSIIKYSDAVKKSSQETIVVKPKKDEQSSATKLEIQNKIDPSTLGVEVTKVKHTRNGGVAISCTNKEDVKSISENIKEKLGEDYEIQMPIRKNPEIRIRNLKRGLLTGTNSDEFIEKIISQNKITTPEQQLNLKVLFNYKNKKGRTDAVL